MITTQSALTLNIAIAFGVYMIAAGFSGFTDKERWESIIDELRGRPALSFMTGVVVYTLGVVLVLVHNDWSNWFAGLVSLIGWAAILEGILFLAFPKQFLDLLSGMLEPRLIAGFAIFSLALGAILLLLGLTGQVG